MIVPLMHVHVGPPNFYHSLSAKVIIEDFINRPTQSSSERLWGQIRGWAYSQGGPIIEVKTRQGMG